MATHLVPLPANIERKLSREAQRRDREALRREEAIATLAKDLVQKLSASALLSGDSVEVYVRSEPPGRAAELTAELREYIERNSQELWPSPAEQALLRALRLVPGEGPCAPSDSQHRMREGEIQAAWDETHRQMMDAFAADPALAVEFSAPLQNEPEDELLRRAWAREFRSQVKRSP